MSDSGLVHGILKFLSFQVGLRRRTYTVLSGSVLAVWKWIEEQISTESSKNNRMQVIRLKTTDGTKIVGILVPRAHVGRITKYLSCHGWKIGNYFQKEPVDEILQNKFN